MFTYSVTMQGTSVSAAITLIQIKAGAAKSVQILRAWVGNTDVETSNQLRVRLLRKTATATVTSFTPIEFDTDGPAAGAAGGTSATGVNASAEGTDGDVLVDDGFNILNGWLWVPTPEERIVVPAAGFLGLKLPAAPAAATVISAGIIFGET